MLKDFPVFTTDFGVASLVLREVPYTKRAYITIHSALQPAELLKECVDFCCIAGAEEVFASGHQCLEVYTLYTSILKMHCMKEYLEDTDAALWPVDQQNIERWRELYNCKSVKIPNGAWLSEKECRELLSEKHGYFVHRDGALLGTGLISGGELLWVSSFQKGAGADVVKALAHGITEDVVTLKAASANQKAMDLYVQLGFAATEELIRWYKVK